MMENLSIICKDVPEAVETRFGNSNYELDRLFPNRKNKNVIWLMKDELGVKIMRKIVGLRTKSYNYLKDDGR